jgi:O-antigen ligase
MFVDKPLFGVGLNGYREALEGPYRHLLPFGATNFLSHSAAITVMAELGLLGLSVMTLLFYRFGRLCWHLYGGASVGDRGLVAGLVGATLAILVSSQSEPRFVEDSYLWLILGLTVALAAINQRETQGEVKEESGLKR